ncbi:MAG: hypothetical protein KJ808_03815 [Acidobacteria bacterium]|nr:hypothetical protein [Acidobacteriota bacterium]MCG2811487.1 hypothetical protein [Candidatus Aminicenantes bacterium]
MYSANCIDWAPGRRQEDRDGFAVGVKDFYQAFPDFYADVKEILIDEALTAIGRIVERSSCRAYFLALVCVSKRFLFPAGKRSMA